MKRTWKLLDLLNEASAFFDSEKMENPRLQAELLLSAALGLKRLDLYLQFERALTEKEVVTFRGYVRKRRAGAPVQYITGEASFRLLELEVSPAVLIPRPETETVVDCALEFIAGRQNPRVLDLGCGSGAIAVSVAFENDAAKVMATDLAIEALLTTRRNAERHGVSGRVALVRADLLCALAPGCHFDVVVCNPPYIRSADLAGLDAEVRDFEPQRALDGGSDGLNYYRRLAGVACSVIAPGGHVVLEVGDGQAGEVCALLRESGSFNALEVRRDLAGSERVVVGSGVRRELRSTGTAPAP